MTVESVAEAKATLLAEEAAAKVPLEVKAAVEAIKTSGHGQPTLGGDAAKAWAAATGLTDFTGDELAGAGTLAVVTITDPADLGRLAEELKTVPASPPADAPTP